MNKRKTPAELRSARWFAEDSLRAFGHRSRMMQMGYDAKDWTERPIIAIINTWSDINQCHAHFKERVVDVKRGIHQAGGLPIELPAMAKAGTENKKAYAALPKVTGTPELPTVAESTKAATAIAAAFPA